MEDGTAHLTSGAETDPNAQLKNAADAFRAFDTPSLKQPRNEQGQWDAGEEEQPEEAEEELEDAGEALEGDDEAQEEDESEAAVEAQPMPPSWPADQAEQWSALPADTQAFLVKREAEREQAVNAKFQESANIRKAAEAEWETAKTNRAQYTDALGILMQAMRPTDPDPREYGAGTGQYDREGYDLAVAQSRAQADIYAQLAEQLNIQRDLQAQEDAQRFGTWKQEHEAQWGPKFVAEVPGLSDQSQAQSILTGIIQYGTENGLGRYFEADNHANVTSDVLRLLWKAQEYDRLKTTAPEPKPKPKAAGPSVKPGVSSPRSAQKKASNVKARERLAREGTIQAGAAVWKQFL